MTTKPLSLKIVLAAASVAFSVNAAAVSPLSFEQATAAATNLKGCQKKFQTKIYSATVLPANVGGPKGIYLSIAAGEDSPNSNLVGPLKEMPTAVQLASLKGKPMCNPPE